MKPAAVSASTEQMTHLLRFYISADPFLCITGLRGEPEMF